MTDRFTSKMRCAHCGNEAPMRVGATLSQVEEHQDPRSDLTWDAGPVYELLVCPACKNVSLQRYVWQEYFVGEDLEAEVVYPRTQDFPRGLPATIQREFEAALKVRSVSPNAYGVLLGRLLELVCDDRGAKKGDISKRLRELAERQEIPGPLVEVAENLLELRHLGAHATVGDLTESEVPILDSLCRAILEYLYGAPHLVEGAQQRLAKLRTRQKEKKGRTGGKDA